MSGKAILEDVRHALDAVPLEEAGKRTLRKLFVVQVDIQDVNNYSRAEDPTQRCATCSSGSLRRRPGGG